jgi:hypothetical protein
MKLLFGGFIAVILLGLSEYAVYEAIVVVRCISTPGCTQYTGETFTNGFSHATSLIGGLVSGLVIAELAVRSLIFRLAENRIVILSRKRPSTKQLSSGSITQPAYCSMTLSPRSLARP